VDTKVPVLITCDLDPTPEMSLEDKQRSMETTQRLFDDYGIKGTYFVVANLASNYQSLLKELSEEGHEIGCHGLTHEEEEEYHILPENVQRTFLKQATDILENVSNKPVRSFRGPRVKTSHTTQKILEELNYSSDCSVCSQRIDFISSNFIKPGWIFAPRLPYHPSEKNAFKKGNRKILVVPVSAMVLPFISGSLYIFGLGFMKKFFDILYKESMKTGKPIVYLMHPTEFATETQKITYNNTLADIKARGFYFRRRFKLRKSENERLQHTKCLIYHIKKYSNIDFMTINQYVKSIC
jgi:peptidoglycan/xylan/chitin deacetylase (PgdA/CDA1 family)